MRRGRGRRVGATSVVLVGLVVAAWVLLRPPPDQVTASDPVPFPVGASALDAVQGLTVKGRAPKTGYDRELFGEAWLDVDGNGCDTRNGHSSVLPGLRRGRRRHRLRAQALTL